MEFVKFLDKIPEKNRTYLGMYYIENSWQDCVFCYRGIWEGAHVVQDLCNSAYLEIDRLVYLRDIQISEGMIGVEKEVKHVLCDTGESV